MIYPKCFHQPHAIWGITLSLFSVISFNMFQREKFEKVFTVLNKLTFVKCSNCIHSKWGLKDGANLVTPSSTLPASSPAVQHLAPFLASRHPILRLHPMHNLPIHPLAALLKNFSFERLDSAIRPALRTPMRRLMNFPSKKEGLKIVPIGFNRG